jgi:uncharacterized membrane protein YdbT with pleckstrin-like domain
MTIEKVRSQIIANIWQSIAQNKIDLSSISQADQEKLIQGIADSVLSTFDSLIGEEYKTATTKEVPVETGEVVIWEGRPFLSMVESYVITSERIKIISGFMSRHVENFELIRVQDIDYKQSAGERMFGLGDLTIRGHDPSDPTILLRNVAKPEEVYELLRRAWLDARKRYGLQFREYM